MSKLRSLVFCILVISLSCQQHEHVGKNQDVVTVQLNHSPSNHPISSSGGALLLPNFKSLDALKAVIQINYEEKATGSAFALGNKPQVSLIYNCRGQKMGSTLMPGVDESDFLSARKGNVWGRIHLLASSPYTIMNKSDLERIEILSRRRDHIFGEGDVAFYDLAETMSHNITSEDLTGMSCEELSEKGYLNTFNHVVAQCFMTTIFSETLADFVGDVHERSRLPELVTGKFTESQIQDLNDGAVDNYVDMINNESGQELGKVLRKKYAIERNTYWTPELLANYLNDIQSYHSWVFQIGFDPFSPSDEVVVRFANKINRVIADISSLRKLK